MKTPIIDITHKKNLTVNKFEENLLPKQKTSFLENPY